MRIFPTELFLKSVLGYVDTEHYSYSDLTSEIYLNSGGLDFSVGGSQKMGEPGNFTGTFTASVKVLYEKLDFAFEMLEEILLRSKLQTKNVWERFWMRLCPEPECVWRTVLTAPLP